jgi:hypothetical protein
MVGALAAQFKHGRGEVLRRRLVDDLADLRAAGEEDEIPVLVEQGRRFRDRALDHRYRVGVHVPGNQLGDHRRAALRDLPA